MNNSKRNDVKRRMIDIFDLEKLYFDFMGYTFNDVEDLSYHHLRVPARKGGKINVNNGSLLVRHTAHDYIHQIEKVDLDIFKGIRDQMIIENNRRKIEIEVLKRIRDMLLYFEKEHCSDRMKNGKYLIREEYIRDRIKLTV